MVVTRTPSNRQDLVGRRSPSRYIDNRLPRLPNVAADFQHVVVPFDEILDVVKAGNYNGQPIDAGLIIHEGQLTYAEDSLHLVVDLGKWWMSDTGLPLPLGCNGVRKDLGMDVINDVNELLYQSIKHGLEHRNKALDYALGWGRGLARDKADTFVGMYVNDWTLDFGIEGAKQSDCCCVAVMKRE